METTKEMTLGQKLSKASEEKVLLIVFMFISILIGAVAFLLEPLRLIQPTRTWATWLLIAVTFFVSWLWVRYMVGRMANIYNADFDQRQAATVASAQKLEWLKKCAGYVQAALDSPSWAVYLADVSQRPTKSNLLEAFESTLKTMLEQMAVIKGLDESGLVYATLSSHIIGDLKLFTPYSRRQKAESDAAGAWDNRIARVAATLLGDEK